MMEMKDNQWRWLKPYIGFARWVGWLLIFFAVFFLGLSPYEIFTIHHETHQPYSVLLTNALGQSWQLLRTMLMPGILSMGIAQFLRWIMERDSKPGLLLRHGPRLLLIAAAVYFFQMALMIWRLPDLFAKLTAPQYNLNPVLLTGYTIIPNLLMQVAPVIILLGLAEALRRLGPIVDESKELI